MKALLKQFEVQDIETAIGLTEHLDDYVLTPEISSPQETAIDQLHFMTDDHSVELLISHVNLYAYGCDLIRRTTQCFHPTACCTARTISPCCRQCRNLRK